MTIIAFISTALFMLVVGWWIGIWCGRQVILDEKNGEPKNWWTIEYHPTGLEVSIQEMSIPKYTDAMKLTESEANDWFEDYPAIHKRLRIYEKDHGWKFYVKK